MAVIDDFEERLDDNGSLYNIYTLSFNNIKESPDNAVEVGRHFARIIRLEKRLVELKDQFESLVELPVNDLRLMRRSFSSHSSFKWQIKLNGKWATMHSYDPRMDSYLEKITDEFLLKTIKSYFFEVELIDHNLFIEWHRYNSYCFLTRVPEDEIFSPKHISEFIKDG